MVYKTSIVTISVVVGILLLATVANPSMISAQQVPVNPQASTTPAKHSVKIVSPTKGQQVPIGKDLTISGIASANAGDSASHCQVSVIANGVKPYQQATGTGPRGVADYSKWNYILSSNYTTIKPGPDNKITAKYACTSNPSEVSFYSVNITGGSQASVLHTISSISPKSAAAKQTEQLKSNNSIGGNSTSDTFAKQTASGLPHAKLTYLGVSKLPGHSHHRVKTPSLRGDSTPMTGSRSMDQGGSTPMTGSRSMDQGGSTPMTDSRSMDQGTKAAKSEFNPFIFPFGPG
jgi:hypothetical protein